MNHAKQNSTIESVRDALSAFKATCASIGKTILILPIEPLSRLTSLLVRSSGSLGAIQRRTEARLDMRKSTRRQITEPYAQGSRIVGPYWYENPIYSNLNME